jgi:hypothetical protein
MSETIVLRTPTVKSKVGVDRETNSLLGFAVAQVGEASGHGVRLDETTLAQIMQMGNAVDGGAKMRFTHPNMSNDGLGKYLGRASNFRMDGDTLRADAKIARSAFKTPNGDLGNYVLDLAEEDPDAFGASVAMYADRMEELDDKGKPKKGEDGKKLLPVFRLKKLHAVDIVDQPAATNAMFTANTWAAQATEFADRLSESLDLTPQEVAAKVQEFIPRYLASKGVAMSDAINSGSAGAVTPPPEPPKVDLDAVKKEAMELERKRVSSLQSLAVNHKCEHLLASWIEKGTLPTHAKDEVLSVIQKRDVPLGNGGATETEKPKPPADPGQKYRDEFKANEAYLSDQMGLDEDGYVETCLAAEKTGGWVKASSVARKAG